MLLAGMGLVNGEKWRDEKIEGRIVVVWCRMLQNAGKFVVNDSVNMVNIIVCFWYENPGSLNLRRNIRHR